jgi:hypothetical protein
VPERRGCWRRYGPFRHEGFPPPAQQGSKREGPEARFRRERTGVERGAAIGCELKDEIDVRVRPSSDLFEIEVRDCGSPNRPEVQENAQVGDFGLAIVKRIAHRWGVARPNATWLWAKLSIRASPGGQMVDRQTRPALSIPIPTPIQGPA